MNILIVNDDGIREEGLKVLAQALAPLGDLYIVAPEEHQSGQSQSITIYEPLKIKHYGSLYGSKLAISVEGKPADCTRIAIGTLNVPFDLCVSGINSGLNVGSDILYSGTVGAATEAMILGVPAIAISAPKKGLFLAQKTVYEVVKHLIDTRAVTTDYVLNINYPSSKFQQILGVKWTRQGLHHHTAKFEKVDEYTYKTVYELKETEESLDSDVVAFRMGYLSITPLIESRYSEEVVNNLKKQKQLNPTFIYDKIVK